MRQVCVFCGSQEGIRPEYAQAARELGRVLVGRGLGLVYGGGGIGLMRVLADAVMDLGGRAIGVIPQAMVEKELAHHGLTELRVVASMHQRKALMADLADAFVALPGGYGTLEEFCEVLTWSQLGLHGKPCGLLNVLGYYDALLELLEHAAAEGFVGPACRTLVQVHHEPGRLLDLMAAYCPPHLEKWIDREET